MFKVTRWTNNGNFSITDENKNYLHADGRAYYKCGEYWSTREEAQAVLDKYQVEVEVEVDIAAIETKIIKQIAATSVENTLEKTIMFEVIKYFGVYPFGRDAFAVRNKQTKEYLHSDGNTYGACPEWWPTRELAQAVLDKYQPPHVWEHGDVFKTRYGMPMIYFRYAGTKPPQVFCLTTSVHGPAMNIDACLRDATFLFNIREKL